MDKTNFECAPPPVKLVDGLLAVPIDIQHITASLTFDGVRQTRTGDATIEFVMGSQNGNPIFYVRRLLQQILGSDLANLGVRP